MIMSRDGIQVCTSPKQAAVQDAAIQSSSRATSIDVLPLNNLDICIMDKLSDVASASTTSTQPSFAQCVGDGSQHGDGSAECSGSSTPDVDAQILEALKSKDRLFVLKLGEQMEALIKEKNSRTRIALYPENQYQRLLVHRCAAYYRLAPENDPSSRERPGNNREMTVAISLESRIPLRRISELVPAEPTQHPTFKIMRRSELDRRRQKSSMSRPGSVAGEEGDLSDPDPSETGSMGSRSTTSKKHKTIAEREAAYNEARNRIFMGFDEEKERAKERDKSASSSTLSLVSGSGSGSQSGGAGDCSDNDDCVSTVPTESEGSIPNGHRRGGDSGLSSADSIRSFRSNSSVYNSYGANSGHTSGTTSPALPYPSVYNAASTPQSYNPGSYLPPPTGYLPPSFPVYAYPPPVTGPVTSPGQHYVAPYQYFPHYPFMTPSQQPSHSSSDPTSPSNGVADEYPHHPTPFMGSPPYGWMPHMVPPPFTPADGRPPNAQGHPMVQGPHPHYPHQYPSYVQSPGAVQYPGYPPYFQSPPPPPVTSPQSQPAPRHDPLPRNGQVTDPPANDVSNFNGAQSPSLSRHTSSGGSSNGHGSIHHINGGNKRGVPSSRGSWSYSPGISVQSGGSNANRGPNLNHSINGETVGPRLSSVRRTSGASSVSSGHRTPGDETASTASSSTSSSSSLGLQHPSTAKHPLPARPDWAAGLKAHQGLHPPRSRHDHSRNISTRNPNQGSLQNQSAPQQLAPIFLQSTDFPPLSNGPVSSERKPPVAGAWNNSNLTARTLVHGNTQVNGVGTALFNHQSSSRLEDDDHGFERPPPKTSAELFNPKGGKRTNQPQGQQHPPRQSGQGSSQLNTSQLPEADESTINRCSDIESAILVNKVAAIKIQQDQQFSDDHEGTPKVESKLAGLHHDS